MDGQWVQCGFRNRTIHLRLPRAQRKLMFITRHPDRFTKPETRKQRLKRQRRARRDYDRMYEI
jgi:hypothetical protein